MRRTEPSLDVFSLMDRHLQMAVVVKNWLHFGRAACISLETSLNETMVYDLLTIRATRNLSEKTGRAKIAGRGNRCHR